MDTKVLKFKSLTRNLFTISLSILFSVRITGFFRKQLIYSPTKLMKKLLNYCEAISKRKKKSTSSHSLCSSKVETPVMKGLHTNWTY